LDLIKMCDDCRVAFAWEDKLDPHGVTGPVRSRQNHVARVPAKGERP
jgi:hypothetical protein